MTTATARAPAAGSLARLALIPLACLLLGQILLVATGTVGVLDGGLLDTDAYMRLNRVVSLHEGGTAWYDPTYPRINPPEGHVQHWTRPLDAMLLAGAALLAPLLGFRDALHVWGVVINPLFTAGALLALIWAAAPVVGRRGAVLAGFGFLLQPMIVSYGSAGRPDHHGLLLMLFALAVALVPRLVLRPEEGRTAWAAGAVTALAVWVSIEALTFVAAALGTLGVFWLLGRPGMARAALRYAAACTLGLAVALALERSPADWPTVETDRLSVLHLALFAGIALFWAAVLAATERGGALRSPASRALAAALGAVAVLGGLHALFPELGTGPLGEVDPLYRDLRLSRIVEIQPLLTWAAIARDWTDPAARVLGYAAFALVAAGWLAVRLVRERGRTHPLWLMLALATAVFVPLTFHQVRWGGYMQFAALIPYAALLDAGVRRLERRLAPKRLTVARPLALVGGLMWALLASLALTPTETVTVLDDCPVTDVARFLDRQGGGKPRTIMTVTDLGPEILYRTSHSVLSIPNHRPQPGFTATYEVLSALDDGAARALLDRHGVDWVLLCPNPSERAFTGPGTSSENLYRRLLESRGPGWLRPVGLPAPLSETFALYAVEPPQAAVAAEVGADAAARRERPAARATGRAE